MIKLIVGPKGAGKTKTMIDMINAAVKTTEGNIVVIEKSMKLTTDINHAARLLDVDEYGIQGADMLYALSRAFWPATTISPSCSWTACSRSWTTIWTPPPRCCQAGRHH